MGAELLASEGDDLILAADVHVDRDQFLAALEKQAWDEAARLAAEPFLHDAVIQGGAAFEHWVDIERRHGRDLVETAVAGAVAAAIRRGDVALALATAERWRDADPTHEPAWRRLIAAALEAGVPVRARLEARGCLAALAQQGESPSPATQKVLSLADAGLVAKEAVTSDPLLHPELVGRTDAFAALMAAQREVARGAARRVLLSASAGLGKTRMLQVLSERLAGTAMDVTTIAATSATRGVEGSVLADLVLALGARRGATGVSVASARTLVAIAPVLEKQFAGCLPVTDWHPNPDKVVHALEELLMALAEDRPQALLLDDLHQWDRLTEATVCAAIERCKVARLLVVATSRRSQPAFPAGATQLLPPLTVDQVEALLQGIADADGSMLDLIVPLLHGVSSGVPQRVLEAVHWLIERGALERRDGSWRLVDPEVLEGLTPGTDVFGERFARLGETAGRVLRWLAVAEQPLPCRLLGGSTLDPALERGGFVVISDGHVALTHETIGERALELESPAGIRAIQVDVARGILDAPTLSPALLRLAGQLAVKANSEELAGLAFDRWVVGLPARAGDRESEWARFVGITTTAVNSPGA